MLALALALQMIGGCSQVDNEIRCDSYASGVVASAPRETAQEAAAADKRAAEKRAARAQKLVAAGRCVDAQRLAERANDAKLAEATKNLCASPPPS